MASVIYFIFQPQFGQKGQKCVEKRNGALYCLLKFSLFLYNNNSNSNNHHHLSAWLTGTLFPASVIGSQGPEASARSSFTLFPGCWFMQGQRASPLLTLISGGGGASTCWLSGNTHYTLKRLAAHDRVPTTPPRQHLHVNVVALFSGPGQQPDDVYTKRISSEATTTIKETQTFLCRERQTPFCFHSRLDRKAPVFGLDFFWQE